MINIDFVQLKVMFSSTSLQIQELSMSPSKGDLVWKLLEESVKKVKENFEEHSTKRVGVG